MPPATSAPLTRIKLLHTMIWAVMAGSILMVPVLSILKRLDWATGLTLLVLLECVILAINKGRCPLTDWAAQYTSDRAANFDIYLPEWLARNNKIVFGALFLGGEIIYIWRMLS